MTELPTTSDAHLIASRHWKAVYVERRTHRLGRGGWKRASRNLAGRPLHSEGVAGETDQLKGGHRAPTPGQQCASLVADFVGTLAGVAVSALGLAVHDVVSSRAVLRRCKRYTSGFQELRSSRLVA